MTAYVYNIDASAGWNVTGGSASAFVLSSALVNFHFQSVHVPSSTLPLNIYDFVQLRRQPAMRRHYHGTDLMTLQRIITTNPNISHNNDLTVLRCQKISPVMVMVHEPG